MINAQQISDFTVKVAVKPEHGQCRADQNVSYAVSQLRELKRQAAMLKELITQNEDLIKKHMCDAIELIDIDGTIAVRWDYTKPSLKLDADAVKENFNDVYYACSYESAGIRRFCVQ